MSLALLNHQYSELVNRCVYIVELKISKQRSGKLTIVLVGMAMTFKAFCDVIKNPH